MSDEITIKVKQNIAPTQDVSQPIPDMLLANYFGINPQAMTKSDRAKLEEISEYFSDIENPIKKIAQIKHVGRGMSAPRIGTKMLDHYHKYIRIKNSMRNAQAQLEALEE